MKQVYKYDENGLFLEPIVIYPNESGLYVIPNDCTDKELPQPNWKPVFDKIKKVWVDKITEKEKEALANFIPEKSEVELLREENAQLNLAIIDLYEILMG